MNILAIDTSTYVMGVAVTQHDTVLGEFITNLKKNHSIRLMPAIEMLLKEVELAPTDLDRIVVAHGPGSFTGVRIGVTTAKTLAWSLQIPLVGISSLEMLAQNGKYFPGIVSPLIDARRRQVYTGLYGERNGSFSRLEEEQNILFSDWVQNVKKYERQVLFIGNDVELYREEIIKEFGKLAYIATAADHNMRPAQLALLGKDRKPSQIHDFTPNYLRLAEAEAKWIESTKNS